MTWPAVPPLVILFSSLIPGLFIFFLPDDRVRLRTALNLAGAVIKLVAVAAVLVGIQRGWRFEFRLHTLPQGIDFVLRIDPLSMLFVTLSASLWLVTTIYAIGYLEHAPHRSRFFGFFSLCVSATVGIAMAGNPFTFLIFYELLTLSTYPLIVHRGTTQALRAGTVYLLYSVPAGMVLLIATIWLYALAGPVEFVEQGGALGHLAARHRLALQTIFALFVVGLGVKTALIPLDGWLPRAMVAPAPVSALLHAVAVVKAGAFGIVRLVYDIYGVALASDLGAMHALAVLAAATIVWGSLRALGQDDLKRRLAFSTVSQVSYIVLGVALFGPVATIGGLVHLVNQGVMKITLFFCAGNIAETHGLHRISELDGMGRRMPWTMTAFSVAALGMIGLPPFAGFVSKWYLGTGALAAGQSWAVVVLMLSSLLNAAYFLPVLRITWFRPSPPGSDTGEARPALLWPTLITGALVVLLGVFASSPVSPLTLIRFIADQQYLTAVLPSDFLSQIWLAGAFRVDALAAAMLPAMAVMSVLAVVRMPTEPGWSWRTAAATAGTLLGVAGCLTAVQPLAYYVAFSVMTVASYPLVIATGTDEARRAGRLYLGLALTGEMVALSGVMAWSSGITGAAVPLLLLIGFGAKLGVPPFHVALAPTYQAAPPAAASLIGGVLSSAAAVGWLRFLLEWGWSSVALSHALAIAGIIMALTGAVLGSLQQRPAALLGYSTMSQMGILMAGVAAVPGSTALPLFVLQHGLVKAALLLSLGVRGGSWLILPLALALAGTPATGSALAKLGLEHGAPAWLASVLPLTSFATTLMMGRLLWLTWRAPASASASIPVMAALVGLTAPWIYALVALPGLTSAALTPAGLAHAAVPVALGAVVVLVGWLVGRRGHSLRPTVPEGDIFTLVEGLRLTRFEPARLWEDVHAACLRALPAYPGRRLPVRVPLARAEALLRYPPVTGVAFMLLWLVLVLLFEWT